MAENYKHLYEQMKKMVELYQDEIVPQMRAELEKMPKWIPVTDSLPETIVCSAGTAYSEVVNVLTSERKVITAIFDGEDFIGDVEFWEAEDEEITHWAPVPLPLPQMPKEGSDG